MSDSSAGLWLGTVTRVVDDAVFVELPRLAPAREYATLVCAGAHPLVAGDRIAASLLEGDPDRVIVVDRI